MKGPPAPLFRDGIKIVKKYNRGLFILVLRLLELLVSFPHRSIQLMFPVVVMNYGGGGGRSNNRITV